MKNVLLALLVIVIAAFVFVASRPGTYHVERSASVSAPPDSIYARVADFHRWESWSPWEKLDPAMRKRGEGMGDIRYIAS